MQNQIMPDSDYNVDAIGYGILWQTTKQFHAELLTKSRWIAAQQRRKDISAEDVRSALQDINQQIHKRLTSEENNKRRFLPSVRDVFLAFGSGLVSVFLNEIIQIALRREALGSLDDVYWIALIAGILCFLPFAWFNSK